MFQSSSKHLRAFLRHFDDVLGDPEPLTPHPHRVPLRWDLERRPGMVAPRPAHCLSPVRADAPASRRERAAR